ncbi:tRNA isopentenyl-2-thiomethyl-A-37 hydroxylase MiaE [Idiomarina abyssalis]|uniref:tRNA-(Ms[2]io[6]A)-hydroxylase n=1 Tax=Idiomarina abyssalis TaxID=86102 RepID=A0A8I1KDH4_9GAMM|nr:tRNA isopentenyl-2-thiomethyl-A-37 hydroxylase MiaE [Idiomarina abyssalis]KPD22225.1 tRNA hydroxylase [Idiomarina abyssalis]MBJ7267146.1 tRNA-(ms[2]io[6]A)-hydroxylase [Idiomarina abyssalis]MBJ7274174.1 tRNA-(ms[2]io[6]A)-hydroxylase [Idiomarina abyssalis]MBJ7314986.1 tRNA-(ms[2]io[6]A)-hydroxylase [Idiomarina abyssalis]SFT36746.1 tRNA-(ms[2]io[6]A)-hydroxylase [Idiomarina abyssalis]
MNHSLVEPYLKLLEPIRCFLLCPTPQEWIQQAAQEENLPVILLDHLHCELKAAQSAALLLRRYAVNKDHAQALLDALQPYENLVYRGIGGIEQIQQSKQLSQALKAAESQPYADEIIDKMSRLIREELHHFQQVLEIMQARDIPLYKLSASRYAASLISHVRTYEPQALIDKLIIGALIEARSCERFAELAPYLDEDITRFYVSLLRSEARHYQDYLELAQKLSDTDITERVNQFREWEAELITSEDTELRFHSGVPAHA